MMLTVKGRLALAADALAAAEKARTDQLRKRLCEQVMNHLRSVKANPGLQKLVAPE